MTKFELDYTSSGESTDDWADAMDTPMGTDQSAPPLWVQTLLTQMEQKFAQAQQQTNEQVLRLQAELQQVRAQMSTPTITPATPQPLTMEAPSRRPRPVLPDPDMFDGEDKALYPQFKGKLAAKLSIDASAIGGTKELLWYGFSRLKGKAAARLLPWMTTFQNNTEEFTMAQFWGQLDAAFLDRAREQKALDRLNVLRQGNRAFDDLLRELDQLLLEAGGFDWNDGVKKGYLKAAINQTLRDRLVTVNEEPTYTQYCTQVKAIADRLSEFNRIKGRNNNYRGAPTTTAAAPETPAEDPMDWTANRAGAPRAKWVSKEEIERRKKEKVCLRCGKSGHFINNCDHAPAARPSQQAQTPQSKQITRATAKLTKKDTEDPPLYESTEEDLKE
jgi:hypothetical protein